MCKKSPAAHSHVQLASAPLVLKETKLLSTMLSVAVFISYIQMRSSGQICGLVVKAGFVWASRGNGCHIPRAGRRGRAGALVPPEWPILSHLLFG